MNPIKEPNFTQLPNSILDGMAELSDIELRIILVVCRQTFGWHRESAVLSKSFLMKATGMAGGSVVKACELLINRGLLEKETSSQFNGANCFKIVVESCPPDRQVPVHPVDTNKESLKERNLKKEVAADAAQPSEVEFWNANCEPLSKVQSVSSKRLNLIKSRRRDPFFVANFQAAVLRAKESKFCCGTNARGWMANFDWLMRPDTVAKLMEGQFDNKRQATKPAAIGEEF